MDTTEVFLLDYGDGGAGDYLIDDILGDGIDPLETTKNISSRSVRTFLKRRQQRIGQQEKLKSVIQTPPEPGEQIHIVSANKFDFWTWVPTMIDWIGTTENLYCSTWTACRNNVVEMFELWDSGRITGSVTFATGIYFKRRETSVYATLVEGLLKRGGRYKAFETHAKVLLLNNAERNAWYTIEGSANLTSNPRLEQYVITNDKTLYEFHREWFEEILDLETKIPWGGKPKNDNQGGDK